MSLVFCTCKILIWKVRFSGVFPLNRSLRSRCCRCCICLVLVLVLLISWSPIRAKAVGVDQFIGVAVDKVGLYAQAGALSTGATVFAWVLVGLGLIVTTAQAIDLMNQYTEFSGELETSIYYYPDGSWSYGVDMGFVERVRAFLFESNIVVPISHIPTSSRYSECANSAITSAASKPFALLVDDGSVHPIIFYSSTLLLVDSNLCYTVDGNPLYWFYEPSSYDWNLDNGGKKFFNKGSSLIFFGTKNPSFGLADGTVLPIVSPEIEISVGYPEWNTNARPFTDPDTDEEITVLPIPFNPSADPETQIGTLTQPDIWQGTIADPMPDTDTNPDTQPDSPGAPSTNIGDYQIDLKKFFPFCIPFDLYDFFSCLNADPVAPVIEWVIPLPGGGTYPLEIDLSAFDGVAQLLRRLQLLLFCVGLAFKTRDLIKG